MGQAHGLPQSTLPPTLHENDRPTPGPRRSRLPVQIWIFILVVTVVFGFLWYDLRAAYRDTLTHWNSNLSNSADEQVSIETLWLIERRTDTEAIAREASTIRLLSAQANRVNLEETRQAVKTAIDKMARINGFLGGAAADTECRIVAETGVLPEAVGGVQKACREAQARGDFSVSAAYARPAQVLLSLAFPVSAAEEPLRAHQLSSHRVGAVVMLAEPWKTVFSFFAEHETPRRSAQTEITWRDDGEAVSYLLGLRSIGTESVFRLPLGGNAFESQAAREKNLEFGEFTDYRGVRVFGVARPIVAAGASLGRKIDRDQALAEFHRRALLEWLAGALSLLLFGAVIAAQHRQLAMRDLQEKLEQQQAVLDLKRHAEASEERYRAFVANSTEGIYRMETERPISIALSVEEQIGQILQFAYLAECNDSLAKMFGFNRAAEMVGLRVKDLAQVDPRRTENMQAFVRSGYHLQDAEFFNKDAQGNIRHFMNTYQGVVEGGYLLRVWGVLRDITERKRAEEALKESERRYRVLFESAGDAIFLIRGDTFIDCNQKALEMYRCTRDDIIGREVAERYPLRAPDGPDVRAAAIEKLRQARDGQPLYFEWQAPRLDGTTFDAEITMSRLGIEEDFLLLAIVRDVTDRKRAVEALQASEARFRTLIQRAPVAISISRSGRTLYVNQEYLHMYGFQRVDEVIGHSIGEQWSAGCRAMVEERARQRSLGLAVPARYEAVGQRKDGSLFPVEVTVAMVELSDGEASVGFLADITERHRAQEDRQRSFEQLRALAARLQNVREEERKRVAREIHDQLGQALTAIKLDLNSLVRALPAAQGPLSEKGSPLLHLVDETIESVRRISTELRPGMLDDLGLPATLEWAAEEFAARTGTKCLLNLASEQVAIDSETATAVFRIFQETLTNVARHANASEVQVSLAEEDGSLTLEVHDNGKGIDKVDLASANSLGILGMRERALLLGGTLIITGQPGKGTTVTLRIPEVRRP